MGQKENVYVINMLVDDEDKIEQKIKRTLGYKDDLFRKIIDGEF